MSSNTKRSPARQLAVSLGLTEYSTGKVCKNGHISPRRVDGHTCIACDEIYKARQYHKKNDPFEAALGARKRAAKLNNLPFNITVDEIHKPTHCPVFGIELCYERNSNGRKPNKAVIDKFIPDLGYVPGNVFVISSKANSLKSNGSIDEIEKLLEWMKQIEQNKKQ